MKRYAAPETRRWKQRRIDTRNVLIWCGIDLMAQYGFQGTGIEKVLAMADVPKGSFYHYFSSKEDFGYAMIEAYGEHLRKRANRFLKNTSVSPMQQIISWFAYTKASLALFEFKRSPLISLLGQELGASSEGFRTRIAAILVSLQDCLGSCLQAAKDAGEIRADVDIAREVQIFTMGLEGAIMRCKIMQSGDPIDLFEFAFFRGVGARMRDDLARFAAPHPDSD